MILWIKYVILEKIDSFEGGGGGGSIDVETLKGEAALTRLRTAELVNSTGIKMLIALRPKQVGSLG